MVQAIIKIDEHTNRILNVVKAKFGLKDKSEAIDMVAKQYEEYVLERELRPEYIKKLTKIKTQKGKKFSDVRNLDASIKNEKL